MAIWREAAKVSDLPDGGCCEVVVGDRVLALYHVDGRFYALDGVCPHQGGPLGEGELKGTIVTCPWHGWQFDVRTGQHTFAATVVQPTFPIKVEDDLIWVELPE